MAQRAGSEVSLLRSNASVCSRLTPANVYVEQETAADRPKDRPFRAKQPPWAYKPAPAFVTERPFGTVDFSMKGLWAILRGSPVNVCDAMRLAGNRVSNRSNLRFPFHAQRCLVADDSGSGCISRLQ